MPKKNLKRPDKNGVSFNIRSIELYDPTQQEKGPQALEEQPVSSRKRDLLSIHTIGEFAELVKPLYFTNNNVYS